MRDHSGNARTQVRIAWMILAASVLLGVLQTFVVPIWGNVEETGHFEYVRYLVEHGSLPRGETRHQPTIWQSIDETLVWSHGGFMANTHIVHDLGVRTDADWATLRNQLLPDESGQMRLLPGVVQLGEPPGYYVLAALAVFPFRNATLNAQLIVARLVSVLLGALAVWLSYVGARALFPEDRFLPLAVMGIMGLLPSFSVLMSSAGNTMAAITALTFLLVAAVYLIRDGASWTRLLTLAAAMIACAVSKPTAWIGIPLGVFAVLLLLPARILRPVLIGGTLVALLLGIGVLQRAWPAFWNPIRAEHAPISEDAPLGQRVFLLDSNTPLLWQPIPQADIPPITGQTVTIGAWVRSVDSSAEANLPTILTAPYDSPIEPLPGTQAAIPVGHSWTFHAQTLLIPADAQCVAVGLPASPGGPVVMDGLVMAPGSYPTDQAPDFESDMWSGRPFTNLIRNPSAERGTVMIRPAVEQLLPSRMADGRFHFSRRLATWTDWAANGPAIWETVRWVFTTFWARISWTYYGLPQGIVWVLGLLSVIAAAGIARWFARASTDHPAWQMRSLALIVLAAVAAIFVTMARLDPVSLGVCRRFMRTFIPIGYYLNPAGFPILIVLGAGLREWVPSKYHRLLTAALIGVFFFLNVGMLLGLEIPYFLDPYGIQLQPTLLMRLWGS